MENNIEVIPMIKVVQGVALDNCQVVTFIIDFAVINKYGYYECNAIYNNNDLGDELSKDAWYVKDNDDIKKIVEELEKDNFVVKIFEIKY